MNRTKRYAFQIALTIVMCAFFAGKPYGQVSFSEELSQLENLKFYDYFETGKVDPLTVENLGFNEMNIIPGAISEFQNVKALTFFVCRDMDLDQEMKKLLDMPKLIRVTILSNNSIKFPRTILQMKRLKSLTISGLDFKELPEEIAELSELEELNFGHAFSGGCELTELPSSMNKLKKLKSIGLWGNMELELSDDFFKMSQIESLDITYLKKYDPSKLYHLINLKELNITGFPYKNLAGIERLQNLEKLVLEYSENLMSLGEDFYKLDSLKFVMLNGRNGLYNLNSLAQLAKLKSLETLRLEFNKDSLSQFIFPQSGFKVLSELSIGSNSSSLSLESIIDSISYISGLKVLKLSGFNQSTSPSNINALKGLERIEIRSIPISELPEQLLKMPNLESIDLMFTEITNSDPVLIKLKEAGVEIVVR